MSSPPRCPAASCNAGRLRVAQPMVRCNAPSTCVPEVYWLYSGAMTAYRGVVNAGTGAKLEAQIVLETRGLRLVGKREVIGRIAYDDMIVEIQEERRPAIVVRSKTQPIVFITPSTLFLDDLIAAAGEAVGEHILAYVA